MMLRTGFLRKNLKRRNLSLRLKRRVFDPKTVPITNSRAKSREVIEYNIGQELHGFVVKQKRYIPDLSILSYELEHIKTGAKHVHFECEDMNNVFISTFKTCPKDSTGVAHILEHTTLCGSETYPIRDPFFNMAKRSLKTFMNAWTGPDFTGYPFSTQNAQDYYNLMAVYLDSVYFPMLREIDFQQEGHRLEFKEMENDNSELTFKGVVYNEMKGAMADASSIFSQKLDEYLFPTITYGHNSGGEPRDIPKLTYEQLKEFHKTHYHPSNSYTVTYGDLPFANHLQCLNYTYEQFEKINPDTIIPNEKRFKSKVVKNITAPPDMLSDVDDDRQCKIAQSWLLNNVKDVYESTALSILSYLLLNGPNSPLYQSLIESQLGNNYCPSIGYAPHTREATFTIGVQGMKEEDKEKVLQAIQDTLQKVAEEGFPKERIDSVLHQIEIDQRHKSSDFGLHLASQVTNYWIHEANPLLSADYESIMTEVRERLKDKNYFQNLIRKYFLNNNHVIELFMTPDQEYATKESENEKKHLDEIQSKLNESDKKKIIENAKRLAEDQEKEQNPELLPKVEVKDIEREIPKYDISFDSVNDIQIQWVSQPTNGIIYMRMLFDMSSIPSQFDKYLPILEAVLTNLGAGEKDYKEFSQEIEMNTGCFSPSVEIHQSPEDNMRYYKGLHLVSYSLERNFEKMLGLWNELINEKPRFFDTEHMHVILSNLESNIEDSITSNGDSYASTFGSSTLSQAAAYREQWNGITVHDTLNEILQDDLTKITPILKELVQIIFSSGLKICINADPTSFDMIKPKLNNFIQNIQPNKDKPSVNYLNQSQSFAPQYNKNYISLPININYTSTSIPGIPFLHEDKPALNIAGRIMTNEYLLREVRERGGAYGVGARVGSDTFTFTSYRDPNIQNTFNHFQKSIQWICNGDFTNEHIENAKLNVFSVLDKPLAPQSVGRSEFIQGITHEMRQKYRERVFDISKEDIIECTKKHLLDKPASYCVLGTSAIPEELKQTNEWKVKSK